MNLKNVNGFEQKNKKMPQLCRTINVSSKFYPALCIRLSLPIRTSSLETVKDELLNREPIVSL
jgi:hypothetical protein